MKLTIIGHSGYVGQNIKSSLNSLIIEELYLIDSKTPAFKIENYINNSDLVIHCAAIQRTIKNDLTSFYPNFELTKKIVDLLPKNSKLIFVSSIHVNSETPFGEIRRIEENYIIKNVQNFTIYHLPYTFGPFGKPNYNNVFNTFIYNTVKNKELIVKDLTTNFPLIPISSFIDKLILDYNINLKVVDKFDIYTTTLPDFITMLKNIHNSKFSKAKIYRELSSTYDWYREND